MFTIGFIGSWNSEETTICKLSDMQAPAQEISLEVECLHKPMNGWGVAQYEYFTSSTLWKIKPPGYANGLVIGTFNPFAHGDSGLDCHVFLIDREAYYIPVGKPIQLLALSPGVTLQAEYRHENFFKLKHVIFDARGSVIF